MTARVRTAFLAAVSILAACGDSGVVEVVYDDQLVQVVHAARGAGAYDVVRDDAIVARGLEFGDVVTGVVNPPGGLLRVIGADGEAAVPGELSERDLQMTWLISGVEGDLSLTELAPPRFPDSLMANLYVVNAVPGPDPLFVQFRGADGQAGSGVAIQGYLNANARPAIPGDFTVTILAPSDSVSSSLTVVATEEHTFETGITFLVVAPDEFGRPGSLLVFSQGTE